jgi:hypothetical protein
VSLMRKWLSQGKTLALPLQLRSVPS